jgi:xeroderma pigmentosum group C-complementing protein
VQEVEKWRRRSGLQPIDESPKKGKGKDKKGKKTDPRSQRDWGESAEMVASGQVDMSGGDPLLKLLDYLKYFWKKRFRITAPGLRKLGYMSLERLDSEVKSWEKDKYDQELHGERFRDIDEFRQCAKDMAGSRDVGAQLFTALLRGIGLEARMVANLQPVSTPYFSQKHNENKQLQHDFKSVTTTNTITFPQISLTSKLQVGFGWSQVEEAEEKNHRKLKTKQEANNVEDDSSDSDDESEEEKSAAKPANKRDKVKAPATPKPAAKPDKKPGKRISHNSGLRDAPIDLSDSEEEASENDDESVIDITPARPRILPSLPYDTDLLFPHYWTEVLSPVSNTYTPVDPIVLNLVASSSALLERFEPRGGKADKVSIIGGETFSTWTVSCVKMAGFALIYCLTPFSISKKQF